MIGLNSEMCQFDHILFHSSDYVISEEITEIVVTYAKYLTTKVYRC